MFILMIYPDRHEITSDTIDNDDEKYQKEL